MTQSFDVWEIADRSSGHFSNGIEMISRICRFIGFTLTFTVGGTMFLLFWTITLPITGLGWLGSKFGFRSEWR